MDWQPGRPFVTRREGIIKMFRELARRIAEYRVDILMVSLATHFSAMILGISASAILQGDNWPAAARVLTSPSVVFAFPPTALSGFTEMPGDSVQLVRTGSEPCSLHHGMMKLLATEPAVLLSRELSRDSFEDVRAVARSVIGRDPMTISRARPARKCREPSLTHVVIEREPEENQ
ncbi:hypothetical protein EBZ80_03090 [bacterium]|nr:hypothetical protein [bacterium]